MKFFKPDDFLCTTNIPLLPTEACNFANAKLERELTMLQVDRLPGPVYVMREGYFYVEPIEKCTHPSEKVKSFLSVMRAGEYQCECGAKVKPKEFEVVD